MVDWRAHVEREERRYGDGLRRLPGDRDARQRQLARVANAAAGAGLASLMDARAEEARRWFRLAAERYRESFAGAPPGSVGRLVATVKMRVLADGPAGAVPDANWVIEQAPAPQASPIGRYALTLAGLVLGADGEAAALAESLQAEPEERFPRAVADALAGIALRDAGLYEDGLARTLRSFETREAHLEDVPVADTVLILEALAAVRGLAVSPVSALLPAPG